MLKDRASILDATYDVGMSGPGRLHDLFVTHEAMPPGVYKAKGEGITIAYGFHPSPFGLALVMVTDYGMCGMAFSDPGGEPAALADMTRRWPNAEYTEDSARTAPFAAQIFASDSWQANQPLRITMIGTDFEIRVWETLLKIPRGPGRNLWRCRRSHRQAQGSPCRRCRCRAQSHFLCGSLPPRHRQVRRTYRLSLGPDPQTRHPRLGGGAGAGARA